MHNRKPWNNQNLKCELRPAPSELRPAPSFRDRHQTAGRHCPPVGGFFAQRRSDPGEAGPARGILALEESRALIARERDRAERLAADLKDVNEEVKQFAYIISHDMRAPLVNVRGFSAELSRSVQEAAALFKRGG